MAWTSVSKSFRIAAVAPAFLVSGCTDRTHKSKMSAAIEVVISEQTLRASASLFDGSEPYIVEPSEQLTVGIHDQTIALTYDLNYELYYGRPYYGTGLLTQPVAADEPVEMTLDRAQDSESIAGTAPMPIALEAPATIASGTDLVITWSASSSDRMKWYARELNRMSSHEGTIDKDTGTMTLTCDVIASLCTPDSHLELTLQRFRSAEVEGKFAIGSVTVRRFDRVEILVTR